MSFRSIKNMETLTKVLRRGLKARDSKSDREEKEIKSTERVGRESGSERDKERHTEREREKEKDEER